MLQRAVVTPASRRIFRYWILLLVPAVILGVAAILLLRREEARLRQQGIEIEEARQVALGAQVRLIAENLDLFSDDVQVALLDSLAGVPSRELDGFLAAWERTNPLVRIGFRCGGDGRVVRPSPAAESEEARGFLRRFARELQERPPWGEGGAQSAPEWAAPSVSEEKRSLRESEASRVAAQNVQQTQSARRDLRQLALVREEALAATGSRSAGPVASYVDAAREERVKATADATEVAGARPAPSATPALAPDNRGWWAQERDGRWHVLGWVRTAEGDVRGFELALAVFLARVEGALPAELAAGQGIALRDRQGKIVHQRGEVRPGQAPQLRLPLGGGILPGWEVAGYLAPLPARRMVGGYFWVGSLLVGIFVAATVAGGAMLWREARRSEWEAAQKTSFVSSVSHEFKTPLTTIRLYAELLAQGRVRDPAQSGDYLLTIGRETQRLSRLVNQVLDYSRLEQGRRTFRREPVDVAAELRRMLATHRPRLDEVGLKLHLGLPAGALPVTTERDALEQIVLNLLDNACKYAAAGGEVTVTARALAGGGCEIRVADRGPGVPAGQRERIFEQFHRVDDALTAEKSGAGLGLSIARELARGLGGGLRCADRDGGGAEFILQLP